MARTVNRRVQEVDIVDSNDLNYRYKNIVSPTGINESQNFVSVDQNSLSDSDNVYVDEDGVLSSRPAIKEVSISYISADTTIVNIINTEGFVFYHLLRNGAYSVAFKYNNEWLEHTCGEKLTIAFMADMFVFFSTDMFAYKPDSGWKSYQDIIYVPYTIASGSDSVSPSDNLLATGGTTRYIIDANTEMNWSVLNNKDITVHIDDDSYSMKFSEGMQYTFTRKINNMSVTARNTVVSSVGSIITYSDKLVDVANNTHIVTIYYSADGTLFRELPPLPVNSTLGNIVGYTVTISKSGGMIYCIARGANNTAVYCIDTATLSDWREGICEYKLFDTVKINLSANWYVSSKYENFAKVDTSSNCVGAAIDDDFAVFFSRFAGYPVTVTSTVFDLPDTSVNTQKCQQSFLHVVDASSGVPIVKSYLILDNVEGVKYNNHTYTRPSINYISSIDIAVNSANNKKLVTIVGSSTNQPKNTDSYLLSIMLDDDLKPLCRIDRAHIDPYVNSEYNDTEDGYLSMIAEDVAVIEYIFDYLRIIDNPYATAIDVCDLKYSVSGQGIIKHCSYIGNKQLACRTETSDLTIENDRSTPSITFDGSSVSDIGTQSTVVTRHKISSRTLIAVTIEPDFVKSNSNFSKILTDHELYLSAYSKTFKLLHSGAPISTDWNNSILYSFNGKLYAVDWSTPIYIDLVTSPVKYNLVQPNHAIAFVNDFIAIDNKLYYRTSAPEDNNGLYFSVKNELAFSSKITNLCVLSEKSIAVFLEHAVYIITYEGIDSNGLVMYTCIKSKLQLGCRDGDDVLLTYDGSTILLPTLKGLTSLSYEQLMLNNEQVYSYLSDQLSDLYQDFIKGRIRLYQYKSYIIVYSSLKKYCYLYDLSNQSWWKWSCSKLLSTLVYADESLILLMDGKIHKLTTEGQYFDFGHELINWHFTSQKLHFDAPNNYKHIYSLSLESSSNKIEDARYSLKCINYRCSQDIKDADVFEYRIDGIAVFTKRCNYYKSTAFQFKLSSVYNEKPKQFKLANIAIKYRITEGIR